MRQLINVKPLSVNEAWKGRRSKTGSYKAYEKELLFLLANKKAVDFDRDSQLDAYVRFGFSSAGSDIDNPVKPLLDILQKKYGFNDSRIYRLTLEREQVNKGEEYIFFELKELERE